MCLEKVTNCSVKILSIIVGMDFDACIEFIFNHVEELHEIRWCVKIVFTHKKRV